MHQYAGIVHEDKMRALYREAAESRLAAQARPQGRATRVRAVAALQEAGVRASRWLRADPLAHGHRGRLRPSTNPKLAEDA